jgi:predicted phosphodiesterase
VSPAATARPGPGRSPDGEATRVAFLSDVHANFTALAAALASAERRGCRRVVVAGDVVGGGPHPVEVIRLLARRRVPAITGNLDRKVLAVGDDAARLEELSARGRKRAIHAWTALQLGRAERAWLAARPAELELDCAGHAVLVVHGSPLGDEDYVFPSITAAALRAKLAGRRPAVLVCGHSHVPFTRTVAGVRVVNCGSVGRPIDGDPRGSFAIVDCRPGLAPRARIVRFAFDADQVERDRKARGVPTAVA